MSNFKVGDIVQLVDLSGDHGTNKLYLNKIGKIITVGRGGIYGEKILILDWFDKTLPYQNIIFLSKRFKKVNIDKEKVCKNETKV